MKNETTSYLDIPSVINRKTKLQQASFQNSFPSFSKINNASNVLDTASFSVYSLSTKH